MYTMIVIFHINFDSGEQKCLVCMSQNRRSLLSLLTFFSISYRCCSHGPLSTGDSSPVALQTPRNSAQCENHWCASNTCGYSSIQIILFAENIIEALKDIRSNASSVKCSTKRELDKQGMIFSQFFCITNHRWVCCLFLFSIHIKSYVFLLTHI